MKNIIVSMTAALGIIGSTLIAAAGEQEEFAIMWVGKVNEGIDLEQADALIAKVAEIVSQNDGTLRFEISRVGEHLYGYERFSDQDGFLAQMKLVGPLYPQIGETWVPLTVVPTTAVPLEIAEMLKGHNALVPDQLASAGQ